MEYNNTDKKLIYTYIERKKKKKKGRKKILALREKDQKIKNVININLILHGVRSKNFKFI